MPVPPLPATPELPSPVRWAWFPQPQGSAEETARTWMAGEFGCEPLAVPLIRDALNRPQLTARHKHFDVNWSHSGDGLLVGLGEGVKIGVDLERIRPRPRALALAWRFFTPPEAQWLASLPPPSRELAFLRLWCAKEAVLKGHGRGLAFGLDKLVFAEVDGVLALVACDRLLGRLEDWTLREFAPDAGYRAAIAWRAR